MRKPYLQEKYMNRMSTSTSLLLVLMIGTLIGCKSTDNKSDPTKSSVQSDTIDGASSSQENHFQYRALCIEKEAHGGNEYVLSRWLDSREKANDLGQYHGDFKYKGHRWRIDKRVKPG